MRHSSQSDETPPVSCGEVFQGGACDLDGLPPSSLARSSSASDIMEPFIAERVKGDELERDACSILNPPHQHATTTSLLSVNSHTAPPHSPSSPSASQFSFPNDVVTSSSETQDYNNLYNQFWDQTGSQGQDSSSDWVKDWDSAFNFSVEREVDAEESEIRTEVEEDDLFSSIRDYLTHKGSESKEEVEEKNTSVTVETGIARTEMEYAGQIGEVTQVTQGQTGQEGRHLTKSVRHSSVDSTEETETDQRSIYECLELQCQWPSPSVRSSSSLERPTGNKDKKGGNAGKGDLGRNTGDACKELGKEDDKESNERSSISWQDPNSTESSIEVIESIDVNKKMSRGSKGHHSGGVSFRPSTESVQFHNPLESKEAHWRARLRRLSHFHTHSHSAGERHLSGSGAGSSGRLGAGGAGKFVSKIGVYERCASVTERAQGTVGVDNRTGPGGDKDRHSALGSKLSSDVYTELTSSTGVSSGVRGRLGRSALRSRASRSRSQEPGSTVSRHHQGAILGGVYKSVVHALSSKPRPRGQGSSQGSSPQRQARASMGDASLKDLYSHVLGYFGRKTTTPGEDCDQRSAYNGHITCKVHLQTGKEKYPPKHQLSFSFWLFLTGLF